jgi:hypothetical protein
MEEDEMGGVCSTFTENRISHRVLVGKLQVKTELGSSVETIKMCIIENRV